MGVSGSVPGSSGFNALAESGVRGWGAHRRVPGQECECSACIRLRDPLTVLPGGPCDDLCFTGDATEAWKGQALYLRVGVELGCDYRQSGSGVVLPATLGARSVAPLPAWCHLSSSWSFPPLCLD